MEKQITHLCGGYYRSFKQFKIHVEMMDNNMTFLQECARFLLETHEEKNELKQCFTNLFFETYGQQIAGNCGCSHLIFDRPDACYPEFRGNRLFFRSFRPKS